MEFWGVEVKAGESLKVKPELFKLIHVSQAAIGEVKNDKEANNVPLRVSVGEKSYVIGTLSAENRPQLMFDLVFEKEFELSHGWKNGSVYFIGYMADDPCVDDEINSDDEGFESEDEEEVNLVDAMENGKLDEKKTDVKNVKAEEKKAAPEKKSKVSVAEPKKEADSDDSDDDDSEDDSDDEDSEDDSDVPPLDMDSDGPEGMDFSDDSDDEDDSEEDDSEDETPKKVEQPLKKRPAPSAKAAPVPAKKAKQATPEKTGGKKGATPPAAAKKGGKPSPNGNSFKAQNQKSNGQFNKNFKGQQKVGNRGRK